MAAELRGFDAILKLCDLLPLSRKIAKVMGEITAITIGHDGERPRQVLVRLEGNFGDAREILSNLEFILGDVRADSMNPDLLIEVEVGFRFFAFMRVTGVEDGGAIAGP